MYGPKMQRTSNSPVAVIRVEGQYTLALWYSDLRQWACLSRGTFVRGVIDEQFAMLRYASWCYGETATEGVTYIVQLKSGRLCVADRRDGQWLRYNRDIKLRGDVMRFTSVNLMGWGTWNDLSS